MHKVKGFAISNKKYSDGLSLQLFWTWKPVGSWRLEDGLQHLHGLRVELSGAGGGREWFWRSGWGESHGNQEQAGTTWSTRSAGRGQVKMAFHLFNLKVRKFIATIKLFQLFCYLQLKFFYRIKSRHRLIRLVVYKRYKVAIEITVFLFQ